MNFEDQTRDYRLIEAAINFIAGNFTVQPSLEDIAKHVGLSKFHFTRLFKKWAGITPMLSTMTLKTPLGPLGLPIKAGHSL